MFTNVLNENTVIMAIGILTIVIEIIFKISPLLIMSFVVAMFFIVCRTIQKNKKKPIDNTIIDNRVINDDQPPPAPINKSRCGGAKEWDICEFCYDYKQLLYLSCGKHSKGCARCTMEWNSGTFRCFVCYPN